MRSTKIPWVVSGQTPLSSDSRKAGAMARVADFTPRAIAWPRSLSTRTEPSAGTAGERNESLDGHPMPAIGFVPDRKTVPSSSPTLVLASFLEPLHALASSPHLVPRPGLQFVRQGETHELPRWQFVGPREGGDAMRIGIFAKIHGDEPESGLGLLRFLQELVREPEVAEGFVINAYPVCNPTD